MNGVVLGAGKELGIVCLRLFALEGIALQPAHHGKSHLRGEEGVLAVGFLPAPPSRVAEDVDIWCPERQSAVTLHGVVVAGMGVFRPCLVAHGGVDVENQGVVERGGQVHGDGKHRGETIAPHAVKCLVPPFKLGNAETWDGRRAVHHEEHFLIEGKTLQQVGGALLWRQTGVLIGQCLRGHCHGDRSKGGQK